MVLYYIILYYIIYYIMHCILLFLYFYGICSILYIVCLCFIIYTYIYTYILYQTMLNYIINYIDTHIFKIIQVSSVLGVFPKHSPSVFLDRPEHWCHSSRWPSWVNSLVKRWEDLTIFIR